MALISIETRLIGFHTPSEVFNREGNISRGCAKIWKFIWDLGRLILRANFGKSIGEGDHTTNPKL